MSGSAGASCLVARGLAPTQRPYSLAPAGGYITGGLGFVSLNTVPTPCAYDGPPALVSEQQASLVQEQARQNTLVTRRRAFDEFLYERSAAPTWEDDRERWQAEELRRSRTGPPLTEIHSARALNALLDHLQKLEARGVSGSDISLDEETVSRINVTSGRAGHVGLLKDGGHLHWPLALTDAAVRGERRQIDSLLAEVLSQSSGRRADADAATELTRATDRLQRYLRDRSRDLPPGQYVEAKRFLADLGETLRALEQPDAAEHLSRQARPRGKTVAELIHSMTRQGFHFAPAVAGDEAAYLALYRALVRYARSGEKGTGALP